MKAAEIMLATVMNQYTGWRSGVIHKDVTYEVQKTPNRSDVPMTGPRLSLIHI